MEDKSEPSFEVQEITKPNKNRKKSLSLILVAFIFLLAVSVILFLTMEKSDDQAESSDTSNVSVKPVSITGVTEQYFDLHVAKGHYLVGGNDDKLIYDGREVGRFTSGTESYPTSMALSKNGQHHIHTESSEKKTMIYVDGKQVKEIPNRAVTVWAVSDDGSKYLYSSLDGKLMMNDQLVYTSPQSILDAQASSDLSKTLIINCTKAAPSQQYCVEYNLVLDGNGIQTITDNQGIGNRAPIADLSDDGNHYAYLEYSSMKDTSDYEFQLVVDGKKSTYYREPGTLTINNQGRFIFSNNDGVFVGQAEGDVRGYPVRPHGSTDSFINEDGSHLLQHFHGGDANSGGTQPILQLDGNVLEFSDLDYLKTAEIDGSTVYLYTTK